MIAFLSIYLPFVAVVLLVALLADRLGAAERARRGRWGRHRAGRGSKPH